MQLEKGDIMAVKSNNIDMINGPLWGKILKFALFYMLSAFLQQLYNAADVIVVGRFAGETALAGVGTCGVVVNLFLNFVLGLAAGVIVVIGQSIGSGDKDETVKTVHTSIAMAVCSGLLIAFVCLVFARQLLNLVDVPGDIMGEASTYLRIVAVGFVPTLVYNFGSSVLRAKGDNKRPLYIVSASGVINVVLNLFFVCVLHMGAGGVAIATVISQFFTAVAILYILCREEDETRIYIGKIRFWKAPFMKILRLGLPSGLQSSVYSISNMMIQSSINSFGSAAIAGAAATTSIAGFYDIMLSSLYQASVVFVSQNFGAKNMQRIKKVVYVCCVYVFAVWVIQIGMTFTIGKSLLGLYISDNPLALDMGWKSIRILGISYGVLGFLNIATGALRGMGVSISCMITSVVGVCGVRLLWLFTAFKAIGTFESLYFCYPISWAVTLALHMIMLVFVFKNKSQKII